MNVPQLRFKGFEGEWESKKIKDLGEIGRGKSKHRPRNDPRLYGGEYPFIQTSDIKKAGLFLNSYSQAYSEFGFKQSKFWPKGTLCITIAANIAETAILDIDACFPDSIIGFTATSDKSDVVFIKKYFEFINPTLQKMSEGVAQSNLNLEKLASIEFNVPSLKEQKKIAYFFELIEKKIERQQKKIEKLEQFKKGMMQKIFSQELRFKDEDGGEFPEWESTSLEKIAKIGKGFTPRTDEEELWGGDIPWLAISGMNQGKYILEASKTISNKAVVNKRIVPKGTLIMSFKLSIGKLGITKTAIYTNEAICHFYWTTPEISTEFMYYYLSTLDIKSFGSRAAKGVTLNNESLNAIVVKLPRIEEQDSIAKFLGRLDEKAEKEKEKLMILEEQKRGFMQEMFV